MLSVSLNKTFLSISPGGDDPRGNVVDSPGPTPVPADRGHPGTVRVWDLGGVHRYLQESRQVNRLVGTSLDVCHCCKLCMDGFQHSAKKTAST